MSHLDIDIHLQMDHPSESRPLLHLEYPLPDAVTSIEAVEQHLHQVGFDLLRQLLVAVLEATDGLWAAARQHQGSTCRVTNEGHKGLCLKTLLGPVRIHRQKQYCHTHETWFLPFNQALGLEVGNVYLTGSLVELAARAALTMPYVPAADWVDRLTRSQDLLCPQEIHQLVVAHGQWVRQQEKERAQQLQRAEIRRIQTRVRRQDPPPARTGLLYIGADGILIREQPGQDQWLTGYAAVLFTPAKERLRKGRFRLTEKRYVTSFQGVAEFGRLVQGAARLMHWDHYAEIRWLVDGAAELITLAQTHSPGDGRLVIRLDWYHLHTKVKQRLTTVYPDRTQRRQAIRAVNTLLWHGQTREALALVSSFQPAPRPDDKGTEALEKLRAYLERNQPYLTDYAAEQAAGYMISSAQAEKACDVLIAKRQKKEQGMHWGPTGADALAALRALFFNAEWDTYWQPLTAAL
jgi:hypothetical protein